MNHSAGTGVEMLVRQLNASAIAGGFLLAIVCFTPAPARADTAIYYSPSQNAYGWCAGYSNNRAHSCARNYCAEYRGGDCSLALECNDGWGAIAFAADPVVGVGAICGVNTATFARYMALANCMVASRALCWTSTAFNRSGNERSQSENRAFDMAWYAQVMLQLAKYDPGTADGELGSGTRAALKQFQTNIGREPTGQLDDELFWRLVDSAGGVQRFARIIEKEVLEKEWDEFADVLYANAPSPAPALTFTGELIERTADERRLAIATFLSSRGTKCTIPALRAEPIDPSTDAWEVDCAEGSHILMMSDDSWTLIDNDPAPEAENQPSPTAPTRSKGTPPLKPR